MGKILFGFVWKCEKVGKREKLYFYLVWQMVHSHLEKGYVYGKNIDIKERSQNFEVV